MCKIWFSDLLRVVLQSSKVRVPRQGRDEYKQESKPSSFYTVWQPSPIDMGHGNIYTASIRIP